MNREIHKICLSGITGVDRHKAIDIISSAIAMQYHKNVLVINEGYASDAAIEQIPASIKVFIVCTEAKTEQISGHQKSLFDANEITGSDIESQEDHLFNNSGN